MSNEIKETKEQLLIRRVFNAIAPNFFRDHKMSRNFCTPISFPRGLGEDIADYVQAKNPKHYHKRRRELEDDRK